MALSAGQACFCTESGRFLLEMQKLWPNGSHLPSQLQELHHPQVHSMLSRPFPGFWLIHPFIPTLLAQSVHFFFQNLLTKTLALGRSLCCRCAASPRFRWRGGCLFLLLSHRKHLVFYWSEEIGQAFVCTSFSSAVRNSLSKQDKQGSVQQGATMYQETGSSPSRWTAPVFFLYIQVIVFSHFSSGRRKESSR